MGGMKRVELYAQVRRAVYVEGISQREAARRFGIDPRTVAKMLAFSVPPGYRRSRPPARPKLDPFVGIIDQILEEDKSQPAKQQHAAKRIFERLRDEHRYDGGVSIVRAYVHEQRQRLREMFVPLRHDPGHAQVDFGEALAVIAGEERKIHFFAMDLPHSDACLVQAYPGGDQRIGPKSSVRMLPSWPFLMVNGILNGMELRIDKAGRIVVPKSLRERLGFKADVEIEAIEQPDGVLLKRVMERPSMVKVDGLWVHQGSAEPGANCEHILEDVREERMESVLKA